MLISRRDWLSMTAVNGLACLAVKGRAAAGQSAARSVLTVPNAVSGRETRMLGIIQAYEKQGFHRTGTVMQEGEFAWQAPFMWRYRLRVQLPNQQPYETDCNICAEFIEGQAVQVAAAPHNRKRVTVDVGQGKGRDGRASASANTP